jgi:hypothetical protein
MHAAAEAPELRVTNVCSGLLMATIGPLTLAFWTRKPTPERFEIQRASLAADVARRPGEALFLCVITEPVDPPDEAERLASARMISDLGRDLVACAGVIEGRGFRAAVARTVLSGIARLIHSPTKLGFFDEVEPACEWLEKFSPSGALGEVISQVTLARAKALW